MALQLPIEVFSMMDNCVSLEARANLQLKVALAATVPINVTLDFTSTCDDVRLNAKAVSCCANPSTQVTARGRFQSLWLATF